MKNARVLVIVIGVFLPYLARIPFGREWVEQYTDVPIFGALFFGAFNAIVWGSILALSFVYRRPVSLLFPALLGFGFIAWAHSTVDLRADAQAGIALVMIPIFAMVPVLVGGILGFLFDRFVGKRGDASVSPKGNDA